MLRQIYLWIFFLAPISISAQNTVGILDFADSENHSEGFNLLYPQNQSDAFLLNSCGQIVHQWDGPDGYRNHNTCYVQENGDLIRTLRKDDGFAFIWEVSGETLVECVTWGNELKWSFFYLDESSRLHHDIEPTPYGTVLLISWDHHSVEEAVENGRDSTLFTQPAFSPDKVIEYDPVLDSIIWEWKAWDHLVQDRDPQKPNFGIIKDNPNRININWENNFGRADWMHVNSIDYNPFLDQIMINVPTFNEIWIIDHSTTTEEAKTSSGGNSGKGGDLLWRWGNPQTYNRGNDSDQKLFFQHDALWALDYLTETDNDYGNISIFNNQKEVGHSFVGMIKPELDSSTYLYNISVDSTFTPIDFYYEWSHPEPNLISSNGQSSMQILPNGNKLICSGRNGISIELTPEEEVIWIYKTPFRNGFRVEQGTELESNDNVTFRMRRYPHSYPAFEDKDLFPIEYLELNPDDTYCERLLDVEDLFGLSIDVRQLGNSAIIIQNPSNNTLNTSVLSIAGQKISSSFTRPGTTHLEISNLPSGYYLLSFEGFTPFSFIKI